MTESYLTGRILKVGETSLPRSCEVPQGSALGPGLWNQLYEGEGLNIPDTTVVAYAEDLAVVTGSESEEVVKLYSQLAAMTIEYALENFGIALAPEKTEALLLGIHQGASSRSIGAQCDNEERDEVPRSLAT